MSDELSRIVALWLQGRTVREIAAELRVSKNTISGRVARLIRRGILTGRASPIARDGHMPPPEYRAPPRAPRTTLPPPAVVVELVPAPPVTLPPGSRTCMFPLWRHDEPPTHRYCGNRTPLGSSYCEKCKRIVFYRARAA